MTTFSGVVSLARAARVAKRLERYIQSDLAAKLEAIGHAFCRNATDSEGSSATSAPSTPPRSEIASKIGV